MKNDKRRLFRAVQKKELVHLCFFLLWQKCYVTYFGCYRWHLVFGIDHTRHAPYKEKFIFKLRICSTTQ